MKTLLLCLALACTAAGASLPAAAADAQRQAEVARRSPDVMPFADHGADAMAGHAHHHDHGAMRRP